MLFVYDGQTAEDFAEAERWRRRCVRFLAGTTPHADLRVDLDLRPEGKDGPLARSLEGYATYFERWAQAWERQALVRARSVAGDADVGRRFLDLIEPHVWRAISTTTTSARSAA